MVEQQLALSIPNRWFEKRRDFFVRQVVEEFYSIRRAFQDVYMVYLESCGTGCPACADLLDVETAGKRRQLWDRLLRMVGTEKDKGPLWNLKDLCHMVWPETDHPGDTRGNLLDWLIGSLFHETMKLKENMYLLNRYGPAACRIKDRPLDDGPSRGTVPSLTAGNRLGNIIDVNDLIRRAASDAVSQMEQLSFLFSHASYMLRLEMPALAGNDLIVRLLVEQEQMAQILWGERIEEVFVDMFHGDAAEGFCAAGRSYLQGQWFVQALNAYRRALAVSPDNDEAMARTVQLQAVVKENRKLLGYV